MNDIDVGGSSTGGFSGQLNFVTHIPLTANVNQWGGIVFGDNHKQVGSSFLTIQIDTNGVVTRSDDTNSPTSGVADSIQINGYVQNKGGTFSIAKGSATNGFVIVDVTGNNSSGYGYYQSDGANSLLQINQFAQLNLTTTDGKNTIHSAEIDAGTLQGYTVAGSAPTTPNIIGSVIFGNTNSTFFNYTDSGPLQVGWFFIQGNVTLASNTTSVMNSNGPNTDSDTLLMDGNLCIAPVGTGICLRGS